MKKLILLGGAIFLGICVIVGCGKKGGGSSRNDNDLGFGAGNCLRFENSARYQYESRGRYYDVDTGQIVVCRESALNGRGLFGRRGRGGFGRSGFGGRRSYLDDGLYFSGRSSSYAVSYCGSLATRQRSYLAYQFYGSRDYACLPYPTGSTFSAYYGISSFSWVSGYNNRLLNGCSFGGSSSCACGGIYMSGALNSYAGFCSY